MEPLFIWTSSEFVVPSYAHWSRELDAPSKDAFLTDDCPYCGEVLRMKNRQTVASHERLEIQDRRYREAPWWDYRLGIPDSVETMDTFVCELCGYFMRRRTGGVEDVYVFAHLASFDLSDTRVPVDVLGAYLATRMDRVVDLNWRRFEELLAAVFREHDFEVRLTAATRDGGIDLVLVERSGGTRALVQAKRHRAKVGVEAVRELRGVQLREGAPHAELVATGGFTSGAVREARAPIPIRYGFNMELVEAERLARALGVFSLGAASLANVEELRRTTRLRAATRRA